MNRLDRALAAVAPGWALKRQKARLALSAMMHYDAATTGRRGQSWRPNGLSADAAAMRRDRIAWVSRDMVRNTPHAARVLQVIANNVVGDGIIPKIETKSKTLQKQGLGLVESHLDTTAIDADGCLNIYGLQRLAMNCVVESGEVLIRRRWRRVTDGFPLPFQIQVMEPDFLDTTRDGELKGGGRIAEGIQYDAIGRRVGYWLFRDHPGSVGLGGRYSMESSFVPAADICHVFRPDRPGQKRGVPWFAPIALLTQDAMDSIDAHQMRQKIAACFAVFRIEDDATGEVSATDVASDTMLRPGAIETLRPGQDVRFATPPGVQGFDEFQKTVHRMIATGIGLTYESLTGDLSTVNFSSARMGRMEMDRNVSSWQWLMLIPQMMAPIGRWFLEAWAVQQMNPRILDAKVTWVPPRRVLIDPTKEVPAIIAAMEGALASWQGTVRELGMDPERLLEEMRQDIDAGKELGVKLGQSGGKPAAETPPDQGRHGTYPEDGTEEDGNDDPNDREE